MAVELCVGVILRLPSALVDCLLVDEFLLVCAPTGRADTMDKKITAHITEAKNLLKDLIIRNYLTFSMWVMAVAPLPPMFCAIPILAFPSWALPASPRSCWTTSAI